MSDYLLFYDGETSGLPDWKAPSESPQQPHIVQLAACLVNADTRAVVSSMDVIIKPSGWTIADDIVAVHGITNEFAGDVGVPEAAALGMLLDLWDGGRRVRVGHNESFDARIIRIGCKRFIPVAADPWKAAPALCTQRMATPIVKAAPTEKMIAAGRSHTKTCNLAEAYEHFTGQAPVGAHTAMGDVRMCMAVYWGVVDGAYGGVGRTQDPEPAKAKAERAKPDFMAAFEAANKKG